MYTVLDDENEMFDSNFEQPSLNLACAGSAANLREMRACNFEDRILASSSCFAP